MSFKDPAVGDPVNYRGALVNATGITLTPAITVSVSSGVAPLVVQASAETSTASASTGSIDPWGEVEYLWTTTQSVLAANTFTHPWRESSVCLDRDIVSPRAAFVFWEPGSYTITLRARVWNGSAYTVQTTTQSVTVTARANGPDANRFIDPGFAYPSNSNDGLDPWGFGNSNYSPPTFTFNSTTKTITASSGTPFAGYTHSTAVAQQQDVVALMTSGGTKLGLFKIASKTSSTVITLASDPLLPSSGTVLLSTGPKETWAAAYDATWWGASISNKTLWIKRGSTLAANNEISIFKNVDAMRILPYGDVANGRYNVTLSDYGSGGLNNALLNGVFNPSTLTCRDIFVSGLNLECYDGSPTVASNQGIITIIPGSNTTVNNVYLHDCRCHKSTGTAFLYNGHNDAIRGDYLGSIGCEFDAEDVEVAGVSVYVGYTKGYIEVATKHGGGGDDIILNHHTYASEASHMLLLWGSSVRDANSKNFFYKCRANYSDGMDPSEFSAVVGCKMTGTQNCIAFGDESDNGVINPDVTKGWDDVVVADCWFNGGFMAGSAPSQGFGIVSHACRSLTILDCIDTCLNEFLRFELGSGVDDPLDGEDVDVVMQRVISYGPENDHPTIRKKFINELHQGSGRVRDIIAYYPQEDSIFIKADWNAFIYSQAWMFDFDRIYLPDLSMFAYDSGGSTYKSWTNWTATDPPGQDPNGDTSDPGYIDPDNGVFFRRLATSETTSGQELIEGLDGTTEPIGPYSLNALAVINRRLWNIGTNQMTATSFTPNANINSLSTTTGVYYAGSYKALGFRPKTSSTGTGIIGRVDVAHTPTPPSSTVLQWSWNVT